MVSFEYENSTGSDRQKGEKEERGLGGRGEV